MIQRLRRQFVLISVAVLAACMLLLAVVINAVNWISVRSELSDTVDELAAISMNMEHGKGRNQRNRRGESLYESRYFIVTDGNTGTKVDISNVSSYTEEDARQMAEAVTASRTESGFMDECFYRVYAMGNGSTILFLDCGSRLSAVYQLTRISLIACCAGIALSWFLMVLFSGKAIQPILENTEKQKRFITDASHELKTPLSVISANMDVMAMDDPDNEWILSTRRQVGLLSRMVRDMVFLAKADEETTAPVRTAFDLADLLRETSEPFVMTAEAGKRRMSVDAPEHLSVRGDVKVIERLISVLCDNAVKYSPENDEIHVSLSQKGHYAIIESENTPAKPVSEENLKHLFDRFYRADESRTKKSGQSGFGIGLAIAMAVAEEHAGSAKATLQNGRLKITCKLKICELADPD